MGRGRTSGRAWSGGAAFLPHVAQLSVVGAVLDRLKHNPLARHIPVHAITIDEAREHVLRMGAQAVVMKPPQTREPRDETLTQLLEFLKAPRRRVLLVSSDAATRAGVSELVGVGRAP